MSTRNGKALLVTDDTFSLPSVKPGTRRVLLINPPIYDTQYWAHWSQPAGLLRIGTLLKDLGYTVELIDCLQPNERRKVKKTQMKDGESLKIAVRGNTTKRLSQFGLRWEQVEQRLREVEVPDQVWISSMMTYWWESTRDMVRCVRAFFPKAEIIVGGLYPTLAPEHALERLGADIIFQGEITNASDLWTNLDLYDTPPSYAILTTSRGCPWDCHYCAAHILNNNSKRIRVRSPEDVLDEIEDKMSRFGIREFGFYEDNSLAQRGHLQRILELIIERGLNLELYAPEGFETRLLDETLLRLMKQAGFEKIYLPFETLKQENHLNWNRRHANTDSFEKALDAAMRAGFRRKNQEINAFVLFGLPGERLEDVLDSVLYVHHVVGSIIPMLFTPVPGTHIYHEHWPYLHEKQGWDLHDLNGKLLPFLEYNQCFYPELQASDYLDLESLMFILNRSKFLSRSMDLCDDSLASITFREMILALSSRG